MTTDSVDANPPSETKPMFKSRILANAWAKLHPEEDQNRIPDPAADFLKKLNEEDAGTGATANDWEAGTKAAGNIAKTLERGAEGEAKLQMQTPKKKV